MVCLAQGVSRHLNIHTKFGANGSTYLAYLSTIAVDFFSRIVYPIGVCELAHFVSYRLCCPPMRQIG